MRGKPIRNGKRNVNAGITPADAGKTLQINAGILVTDGSPPRMRGKLLDSVFCQDDYNVGISDSRKSVRDNKSRSSF